MRITMMIKLRLLELNWKIERKLQTWDRAGTQKMIRQREN